MSELALRRPQSMTMTATVTMTALVVALWSSAPAYAAPAVRMQVQAGLGGVARPGTWTPVRVAIENTGGDLAGELVIEWGDARVHRQIVLAAPAQLQIESYVRTVDVRGTIAVRLVSNGVTVAAVDAPVRIAAADESVTVCITTGGSAAAAECTVTLAPEALPLSMRGYDAADVVTWRAGPESGLRPEQRAALRRWRALHALQQQDDSWTSAPRATADAGSNARGPASSQLTAATGYGLAVAAAAIVWLRRTRPVSKTYILFAIAIGVATLGAATAGRIGPGAAVLLRHATTVRQIGDASIVTMRGTLEYPAFDGYVLRTNLTDGALRPTFATTDEWVDDAGTPFHGVTRARGAADEVEFEGIAPFAPLHVTAAGGHVRVQNASSQPLSSCRFPDGFSRAAVGTLAPGAIVDARVVNQTDGGWFTCEAVESPLTFTDARYAVRSAGIVLVAAPLSVAAGAVR